MINKVDRPDARIKEVVDDTYELFLDLDADEEQIDFPIVYACARDGIASLTQPADGTVPDDSDNLEPLFQHPAGHHPGARPTTRARRCRRTSPTSTPRRSSAGSRCAGSAQGTIRKGQTVAWCRTDGTTERVRISELLMTEGLERKPAESAGPGDIIAVAGIPEIMIGETLADAGEPGRRCR